MYCHFLFLHKNYSRFKKHYRVFHPQTLFGTSGRSLTTLTRKDKYYILEILITPKVFLHQCKLGVGRWSVIEKMVNIVKERPPRCAIASRAASRLLRLVPLQSPALTAVPPVVPAPPPAAITNVRLIRHVESSGAQGAKVSTLLVLRSYVANKSDNTVDQIFDNCLKTWIPVLLDSM